MNPKEDTQPKHLGELKCLGTISSNCSIVDRLRGSIKYHSRTHALLWKGPETIDVFTWPGSQAGHVDEPLVGVLKNLLVGPIDEQTSVEILYPTVLMGATIVASPTPIPTLTVILILFTPKDQSARVLRIFDKSNIKIQNVEGYYPKKCGGFPHLSHLESPESNILPAFWDSPTCKWLKNSFNNSMNIAGTSGEAESFAETDERNAKATLVICPLLTLGNWEAEIQKHLEPRLIKYVVYHGDKPKNNLVLHNIGRSPVLFGFTAENC
ncbi:uncharacterized protein VP01_348g6 [Puccinia sorghi]|uniref:SNF2 N-terminal domain-containing protein n=1 Tax=Puccinia sorghi TaxID=27349 RepID=A0A0L6UVX9_9BASI|nr:uncharacterized protein VP01_348g6 [Puccinia sorghi]